MKELLLCHYHKDAPEVHLLADELRLRGIVPWVDKDGGFSIGDNQIDKAERVLREECFGLLLYATEPVFSRDFIRKVEVETAIQVKEGDPSFVLVAVPRRIDFEQLTQLSVQAFGVDLAKYASVKVTETEGAANGDWLHEKLIKVSTGVCDKYLDGVSPELQTSTLQLQFSTRDCLKTESEDLLCVDATRLMASDSQPPGHEVWNGLYCGLLEVKRGISKHFGRPRLRVHGSKHLTAAFMLGHVFPSSVCELDLRTKYGYWTTDLPTNSCEPMEVSHDSGSTNSNALYAEISTVDHVVRPAVRRYIQCVGSEPVHYVRFRWQSDGPMTNADARAMAKQIRTELARTVSAKPIDEIHLFAAIPQALSTMIGHMMNAMPPIQLYEYDGRNYAPSFKLP